MGLQDCAKGKLKCSVQSMVQQKSRLARNVVTSECYHLSRKMHDTCSY